MAYYEYGPRSEMSPLCSFVENEYLCGDVGAICANISLVEGGDCNTLPLFKKSDNRAEMRLIVLHMFYAFAGKTPPRALQEGKTKQRKCFVTNKRKPSICAPSTR